MSEILMFLGFLPNIFSIKFQQVFSQYRYEGTHRPGLNQLDRWTYNINWWSNRGLVYVRRNWNLDMFRLEAIEFERTGTPYFIAA